MGSGGEGGESGGGGGSVGKAMEVEAAAWMSHPRRRPLVHPRRSSIHVDPEPIVPHAGDDDARAVAAQTHGAARSPLLRPGVRYQARSNPRGIVE